METAEERRDNAANVQSKAAIKIVIVEIGMKDFDDVDC
jgi:hypothetical protein